MPINNGSNRLPCLLLCKPIEEWADNNEILLWLKTPIVDMFYHEPNCIVGCNWLWFHSRKFRCCHTALKVFVHRLHQCRWLPMMSPLWFACALALHPGTLVFLLTSRQYQWCHHVSLMSQVPTYGWENWQFWPNEKRGFVNLTNGQSKRIPLLSYFQEILCGGGEEDKNYDLVQENYLQLVPRAFENKKIIVYCSIYDKCFDFY